MGGPLSAPEAITVKSAVLRQLRNALYERDFLELTTPVARRADCRFRPRPVVEFDEARYLREAIGPALRFNLQHHPRVFEIGPCFRFDSPDAEHAREFTMLDLYAAHESMEFLLDLATKLVATVYTGPVERVSVAVLLKDAFDVDPAVEPEEALRLAMVEKMRISGITSLYEAVEVFATRALEPMSAGRAVMFSDFPTGTEVCAKQFEGSAAILNRFELYIDGVEVVHGYEDDDDAERFIASASEICFFNAEQERVQDGIKAGRIPQRSVGLGIGIERLCMVCNPSSNVHDFLFSSEY